MDTARSCAPLAVLFTSAWIGLVSLSGCTSSSPGDDEGGASPDSGIDLGSDFEASPSSFELEGAKVVAGTLAHDAYAKRIDIDVDAPSDDIEIGPHADYFARGGEYGDTDVSERQLCGLVFEVTNVSDEPQCHVGLSLGLLSESGQLKSTVDYVEIVGTPGRTPAWEHSIPCLAPGESGWAIASVATERCFEVEGLRVGDVSSTAKPDLLVAPHVVASRYELSEADELVVHVENEGEDADDAGGYVVFLSDEGRAVGMIRFEDSAYLLGGEGALLTESLAGYPFGTVDRIRVHLTTDS